MNDIQQYLHMMIEMRSKNPKPHHFLYLGMEDFLIKHGQPYTYQPLPNKIKPGIIKLCFQNAFNLAKKRKWLYVEGVAMGIIPVHHAWTVNPKYPTVAIDNTWNNFIPNENRLYFGTPFNLKVVAHTRKQQTTMLDDWQNGFPLLTGKTKDWQA